MGCPPAWRLGRRLRTPHYQIEKTGGDVQNINKDLGLVKTLMNL
jgi:hypothetical protein